MKLKKVALLAAVLLTMVLAYRPAQAGVDVGVGVSVGLPVFTFSAAPQLAVIPGTYAYYVPGVSAEVVFYQGRWYRPWGGRWYHGRGYNGPWVVAGAGFVPAPLLRLPRGYRNAVVYERISYDHVHRNWRTWERDRHWEHKHDWWRKGRDDYRRHHGRDWDDRREAREDKRERKEDRREAKEDKRERKEDRREAREDKKERQEDRREAKEDRAAKSDRKGAKLDGDGGQRGGKNVRGGGEGQRGGKNINGGGGGQRGGKNMNRQGGGQNKQGGNKGGKDRD